MNKPNVLSTETQAGPDGSIFLPSHSLTIREIDNQLFEMHLCRGKLGDLEPAAKVELAADLNYQRARLAEIALKAI